MMTSIRILTPSLLAVALVSCASQKADQYDTSDPYGTADSGLIPDAGTAYENPVYDTPAAYEESTATNTIPAPPIPSVPTPPAAPATGPATIHTVVKGDTLSGISSKYQVPIASIKAANQMTNDIVVLGRKMVIPPR